MQPKNSGKSWIARQSPFIAASALTGFLFLTLLLYPIANTVAFSWKTIPKALTATEVQNAIFTSFYAALLATLINLLLSIPLAYTLARQEFLGKTAVEAAIDVPTLIPHDAAGVALLLVLSPKSPVGGLLANVGLQFTETLFGVVAAMAFVSSPFMIRTAQEAFKAVNPELEKVARSLGATPLQAFLHITLPLSLRGILTGCLLTWARAISEFGAVVVIAYYPKTIPVIVYDRFVSYGLRAATPITALVILLAIAIFALIKAVSAKPLKPVY